MTRAPGISAAASTPSFNATKSLNDLDLDSFLQLMITELQNQDPLNPLDNKDMLAQISQIREVGATDKLTQTLESVLLGQNISSATNLIGADIDALSDDNEKVQGIVGRVSIDDGSPKLHVDLPTKAEPSTADGNIEKGKYAYRVVWEDDKGNLLGLEFAGAKAVTTTGEAEKDRAIQLTNLPKNTGHKYIYRTDASGQGPYRLVGVLTNGNQGTFVDQLADEERSEARLINPFQSVADAIRAYEVSLHNVSSIKPPPQ